MKQTLPILFLLFLLSSCGDGVRTEPDENLAFGIDVSHYQGRINWNRVGDRHPIEFVFVRLSMGVDGIDREAKRNLEGAKEAGFPIGVYHYYRPNENSGQQARHFLRQLNKLNPDLDFRVVLDIEEKPRVQTMAKLKKGLQNWLDTVEEDVGHKPIIYTGLNYYQKHFKSDSKFDAYPYWIASYNSRRRDDVREDFDMHQFTDQVRVAGISEYVDGNDILRKAMNDYLVPEKVRMEIEAAPLVENSVQE